MKTMLVSAIALILPCAPALSAGPQSAAQGIAQEYLANHSVTTFSPQSSTDSNSAIVVGVVSGGIGLTKCTMELHRQDANTENWQVVKMTCSPF